MDPALSLKVRILNQLLLLHVFAGLENVNAKNWLS